MPHDDRWIAGLDLTPRSVGVVRFCGWLRAARPSARFVAMHVVDPGLLGHLGIQTESHALLERATGALGAFIAQHGDPRTFDRATVVEDDRPSDALEKARVFHQARGIVVGRNERTLGRVTRRLLSAPAGVVAVVPPDFEVLDGQALTVICCCALDGRGDSTVRFARDLASALGGSLSLLHVLSGQHGAGALYMPPRALDELSSMQQRRAERAMADLVARNDLGPVDQRVVTGSFAASVMDFADRYPSCALVCGAHHREGLDRALSANRGMELAPLMSCPVLVV